MANEWKIARLGEMAELEFFQVLDPTVDEYLASIYSDGELDSDATVRSSRIVPAMSHAPSITTCRLR